MNQLVKRSNASRREPRFSPDQLIIKKATWLVQRRFPFVTAADVAGMADDLTDMLELSETIPAATAQDIADFVCDIVADI